ncbi:hypothetical protein PUN28_007363 [Cardiocondyla obscurior]|uniref:Uncharacterized protein n=1 Tax=Cardiocondyla obscurior TaxID=286306 RepID=A0AAW2G5Y3_9HYME
MLYRALASVSRTIAPMMERRIRILWRTSFSRHAKVLQGKLSPMQAAQLANQLGGREAVWLAARLVCWLVGWVDLLF